MNKYKEIRVAILAIVSGTVLYLGFNYLKGLNVFNPDNVYLVEYNNINGLNPSDKVIINGFQVGSVASIELAQGNYDKILVSLAVRKDIILKEGTVAKLVNLDFLGTKAIELTVNFSGERVLQNGDSLISEVDRSITDLITEEGLSAANSLTATVGKVNDALQPIIDGASDLTTAFANIREITEKWKGLSDDMGGTIEQLTLRAEFVTDSIAHAMGSIARAADSFKALGDSLQTIDIESRLQTMDETLQKFNEITDKINSGEGTIGQLMTNDSLYHTMNQMLADLDKLFIDFEANPKRYVHFSLFGRSDKRPRERKKKKKDGN